jgi:death-on-curing protein
MLRPSIKRRWSGLPGNRRAFALSAPYVELMHDWLVSEWWPNVEPVGPEEYRDRGLLESAVARPFQTVSGKCVFQSVPEKAAAFFHSLIANHPFENGNKRTAIVALELFLTANGLFLYLDNDHMYQLAKDTASYVPQGRSARTKPGADERLPCPARQHRTPWGNVGLLRPWASVGGPAH